MADQDSSVSSPRSLIYIGSHICRTAVQRGVKVTSISRTEPKNPIGGIEWRRGDIFEPDGYREALKDANGVIYTAGVLLEGDYKSLAQGDFDPGKFARLVRERVKGRNPLAADPNNPSGYNRINRDGGTYHLFKANHSNSSRKRGEKSGCRKVYVYFSGGHIPRHPKKIRHI